MLFLHQFGPGAYKSGELRSQDESQLAGSTDVSGYVESICARAGLTIVYGMYSL